LVASLAKPPMLYFSPTIMLYDHLFAID